MDYVERKAVEFANHFLRSHLSDDDFKYELSNSTSNFNRYFDKRRFLNIILEDVIKKHDEHIKVCKNPGSCPTDQGYDAAKFLIGQELEDYLNYDDSNSYSKGTDQDFGYSDRLEIDNKLDQVLQHLEKLGLGQEIIFNEIDELRNHTDLKKKNWKQLLKGKLIDISIAKITDNKTIEWIYKTLTDENFQLLT